MVLHAPFRLSRPTLILIALSFVPRVFAQQGPSPASSSMTDRGKFARDRILVKFRHGVSANARTVVHASMGARSLKRYTAVRDLEVVVLPASLDIRAALRSYRLRPEVEYAEPDYTVRLLNTPDDPLFPQMWNLLNTGQNGGTAGDDVGATLAWNLSTGDHNVVIAT